MKQNNFEKKWILKKSSLHLIGLLSILILTSLYIYRDFILGRRLYLFSDVGADTINAYWPFLIHLAENVSNWSFWSLNIGIGTSIFSISIFFQDIFNWLLFLLDSNSIINFLPYLIILKLIVAGLLFYYYLLSINLRTYTSLVFSIYFAFNGYIILWGQHHQFASALVYTVLVLVGFERLYQKSKWGLFCFSIVLLSIFSLYFLYMVSIYLAFYLLFRYVEERSFVLSDLIKLIVKSIGVYCFALLLSAIIILPNLHLMLSSPRVKGDMATSPFFQLASPLEYLSMMARIFSNDIMGTGDSFFGYFNYYESPILYSGLLTIVLLPAVFVGRSGKQKILYLSSFFIVLITLVVPYFSIIMNGFSTASYRWTFILIPFFLTLSAKSMDYIESRVVKPTVHIVSFVGLVIVQLAIVYFGKTIVQWSSEQLTTVSFRLGAVFCAVAFYTVILILFPFAKKLNNRKYLKVIKGSIIVAVIVEVSVMADMSVNHRLSVKPDFIQDGHGYFKDISVINDIKKNDKKFYRIEKENSSVFFNDSLIQNYYGIKTYNSLNQPSYLEFLNELEIPFLFNHPNFIQGTNDFNVLSLLNVKYYLSQTGNHPLGFEEDGRINNYYVYKNPYVLPQGFLYSSYIPFTVADRMSSQLKAELLSQTVVIQDENVKTVIGIPSFNSSEAVSNSTIYYSTLNLEEATHENIQKIRNTDKEEVLRAINSDPQIIFPVFETLSSTNVTIYMEIESDHSTTGQIFWSQNNGFSESQSKVFEISPGKKPYTIELGMLTLNQLRIDLSNKQGKYRISNVRLAYKNISEDYKEIVHSLNNKSIELVFHNDSRLSGNIDVPHKSILFFSIPYDKGWEAYVDGEKANLLKVNYGFLGIVLNEGYHNIELVFEPPLLREGLWISTVSFLAVFVLLALRRKKSLIISNKFEQL